MWVEILIVLALVFVLIYLGLRKHFNYWADRGLAHETPKLILGNMSGLGKKYHWKDINKRIYDKYRDFQVAVGFYAFFTRVAIIIDLNVVHHMLVRGFPIFPNRNLFHNVRDDPLTGNLLFLDGDAWRNLRHKLVPVFTSGKLKQMFPTMVAVAERLVDATLAEIQKNDMEHEGKHGILEIKDLCARYTTDQIGVCAFGLECNSLSDADAKFRCMGRKIFEQPRHSILVQSFMFTNPVLARKLRLKIFKDDVTEFFMNAVKETIVYRKENNVKRNDFMDMLIDLLQQREDYIIGVGEEEAAKVGDKLTNGLSLEQVAAQAMMFFLAGFETSSTTMAFCLYELALNTNVQQTLRFEIDKVMAKHNNKLSYEMLDEMKYLNMVICETLRKHPILPHIVRQCTEDWLLPNSMVVLEKGLRIHIPVDAIHNDPGIYPQPEIFDPMRFTSEEILRRHPFAYLPFGEGPRNCIGMRFAKLQIKIGLIQLIQNFKISACLDTDVPIALNKKHFLLSPEHVYLRITSFEEIKMKREIKNKIKNEAMELSADLIYSTEEGEL